jgi:hypothetical protein
MADDQLPLDINLAIQQYAEVVFDPAKLKRLEKVMGNAIAAGQTVSEAAKYAGGEALIQKTEDIIDKVQGAGGHLLAVFLAWLVAEIIGVDVPASALQHTGGNPEDSEVGRAVADVAFSMMRGPDGPLEPSDVAAKRFLGTLAHITVHSWGAGVIIEKLGSYTGWVDGLKAVHELGEDLVNGLGLSRLARVALRPLAHVLVATPLDWKVKKTFRPTLLAEPEAVKLYLRGKWTREQLDEELARQGWSPERIEAHITTNTKTLSLDEMLQRRRFGNLGDDEIRQTLKDQGYSDVTAAAVLEAKLEAALETIQRAPIGTVIRAYANREISLGQAESYLRAIISDDTEVAFHVGNATLEHDLNVKHMSHAEVKKAVELGVVAMPFYRDWLTRENYPTDEAYTLELLLRKELDMKADVEALRAKLDAERAEAKRLAEQKAKQREIEIEAQRALHRLGPLADLKRAVVLGQILMARYAAVLTPQYDADTVAILVGLAESERVAYLDQQQRADDARKRAAVRHVDVGLIEQAVMERVLTIEEFHARLIQLTFAAADADLLTATLAARVRDRDAAEKKRADAEEKAKIKGIDLGRFEQLVVLGARPLGDYDRLLASLGYDDASRAAMDALLQLKIAAKQAAEQARRDAQALRDAKGVSLDQLRRAVILGIRTVADYEAFLVQQKFTADAQAVLLAEVRADVADADAARQKRQEVERVRTATLLPLSTVAQAARLGLIRPAVYETRLRAAGYTDDDVAIELALLTQEMAAIQATRTTRDTLEAERRGTGPPLATLHHAVLLGVATIDAYRARAIELGYAKDAVGAFVGVLTQEVQAAADAQAARDAIAREPKKDLSVKQLETAVKAGTLTLEQMTTALLELGYEQADAAILTAALAVTIHSAPGG